MAKKIMIRVKKDKKKDLPKITKTETRVDLIGTRPKDRK